MPVYSIGVKIDATAYIKAEDEVEALAIARRELNDVALEVSPQEGALPISGRLFDDPRLPEISLSPAMSINEQPFSFEMLDQADL